MKHARRRCSVLSKRHGLKKQISSDNGIVILQKCIKKFQSGLLRLSRATALRLGGETYRQTVETYHLDVQALVAIKNGGERAILAVFRQHVGDLALKTALLCARSSTTNTHDSVALQTRRRHLGEQIGPDNVIVIRI